MIKSHNFDSAMNELIQTALMFHQFHQFDDLIISIGTSKNYLH